MTTEEKSLSPQDSLHVITDAISKTKENIRENSFYFLLWGWLVAIASFLSFLILRLTDFQFYIFPFPVLSSIGVLVTLVFYIKKKTTTTQTYITYFLSRLWAVLSICFFIVVFVNVSQGKVPFTYTLLVAGIGTLVSGWVMKFRPLIVGGILFLLFAIASTYMADDFKLLVHGIAIVAGYLVPGYLLKQVKA
jgi:hypothetical protein